MPSETTLESLAESLEEIRVAVKRIDESLRGNGRAGLFTDFALVKSRLHIVEKFQEEIEGTRRWVVFGVLGMFGTLAWNIVEVYMGTTQ
jgi:hypothetical protein